VAELDGHSIEFLADAQGGFDRFVYRDPAGSKLGKKSR
jgi:hypothetical protein